MLLGGCVAPSVPPPPPPSAALAPPRAPSIIAATNADFALSGRIEQGGLAFGTVPAGTVALSLDGKSVPFASDRRFLIGFDRDAPMAASLVATMADGSRRQLALSVAPHAWKIESLPTLPRGTTPTPEFLARRKIELDRIIAARATDTGAQGWRQALAWPATGRISGVFGSQRIYAGEPGAFHGGVDVARPTGTPVAAPADGVVVLAADAPFSLEGNLLMIDHGMGLNSAFLHLSRIGVRPGDVVRRGQIVGAIGMTGRATGPHLHWAMKWRDARIDPAPLAGPMR
ncbi:M23 family metallopeptidase [Sphingomonas crocodyli]|uniref:M23 family metallopeptidase n=1 Tax=Sphingomonas crocodyli TaxID=1979270 RepID=A0A437MBK1_9SPHN|nr:M23 family metallopeptidase [Sphingomonas crocodyli]